MYRILIKKSAQKQLAALPLSAANRIADAIDGLAHNPRPYGTKKLQGYDDVYRIRIADYRVVYSIEDKILTIEVIKVGHRKDVYTR